MTPDAFRARYGPWALVAGGSEGLGAEWGRQLAARGVHLVLVAERADPLESHAAELASQFGVEVRARVVDLGEPDAAAGLASACDGLEVGFLVYNAALSVIGPFLEVPFAQKLRMLDVNCRGMLAALEVCAGPMVARGRGGIVLTASLAGLQGSAWVATYAATKAFDRVLAESLWEELRGAGVDVLALAPGATRTPGYEASGARASGLFEPALADPADVVAEGLSALGRGPVRIPGRANRIAARILGILPRRWAVSFMGTALRRRYRGHDGGGRDGGPGASGGVGY